METHEAWHICQRRCGIRCQDRSGGGELLKEGGGRDGRLSYEYKEMMSIGKGAPAGALFYLVKTQKCIFLWISSVERSGEMRYNELTFRILSGSADKRGSLAAPDHQFISGT